MRARMRIVAATLVAAYSWTSVPAGAQTAKASVSATGTTTTAQPLPALPATAPTAGPAAAPVTPSTASTAMASQQPAAASAAVPQPTPPPAAVPAPTPQELNDRRVAVDIQATKPSAVLERRVSTNEGSGILFFDTTGSIWEQVCVTPCQSHLDRFSTYRVRSQNQIAGSGTFTLPQGSDSLRLDIHAGDLLQHRAARAVTTIGTALVIVGVALLAGNHVFSDESNARTDGWITGGVGLGLLAAGIPWLLLTGTHVSADGHDIL